jgi:hypothetical protein
MDTFIIVLIVILVLVYLGQKVFLNEEFTNSDSLKLYVFVSSNCPHCHTYLNDQHADISALAKSKGIEIKKVQSGDSPESNDLFAKFDVQFVPAAILVKDNKIYKKIGSNITLQSVKAALEN